MQFVAKLLLAERRRLGTPKGSRALSCFWQAVLALRWFRNRTTAEALARDHGISRATVYRYLDEAIVVLAGEAPELIPAAATPSSGPCAAWANAGSPCSPAAGAPSSTSPPAPARSAISPAPRSS